MDDEQTNAELMDKLSKLPLAYQPGATFEYGMWNDVVGRIVEIAAGMDLNRFVEWHRTHCPLPRRQMVLGRRWPDVHCGGLRAFFCQMLLNGGELDGVRLLSRKSVELMASNHLPPDIANLVYQALQ